MGVVYFFGYLVATIVVLWSLGALVARRAGSAPPERVTETKNVSHSDLRSAA